METIKQIPTNEQRIVQILLIYGVYNMKKILFSALIALGAIQSFASTTTPLMSRDEFRIGKGDLETKFGISTSLLRGDVKTELYDVSLGGNYFINDFIAPGISFQVQDAGSTNVRLLPNVKVYLPNRTSRLAPYAQVGLGYAHQFNFDGLDVNLGIGANYLLSNTVAIGIQFNYDLVAGDNVIHTISFPIGFALYFKI